MVITFTKEWLDQVTWLAFFILQKHFIHKIICDFEITGNSTNCTYHTQQPHHGEAGGGVVGAIVELWHLIILPGFISVWEERRPLGIQSTNGLRGEKIKTTTHIYIKYIFKCVTKWQITCDFLEMHLDMNAEIKMRNDKHKCDGERKASSQCWLAPWVYSGSTLSTITVARQMKASNLCAISNEY